MEYRKPEFLKVIILLQTHSVFNILKRVLRIHTTNVEEHQEKRTATYQEKISHHHLYLTIQLSLSSS